MACILQHLVGIFLQHLYVPLPGWAVQHACLAETTAADASPLDFQYDPILRRLDKWNHRGFGIIGIGHIRYHLFLNRG